MDDVRAWFEAYLQAFAALGRGESDDPRELLRYYSVPLLLTTDEAARWLQTDEDVLALVRGQVDGMRAAGYERSEPLDAETSTVNATTAIHTAGFARRRADGSEIGRLRATYVIASGADGRRITTLAVHTP